jgi:PST family polysaccharide transporter
VKFSALRAFDNPSHIGWVIGQQAWIRGLAAIKFLVAAKALGPESFGVVVVALVSLAIAESLSDTGLPAALIQAQDEPSSRQLGAVYLALLVRGTLIAGCLVIFSRVIARGFGVPQAADLIELVSAVAIVRGLLSPGLYMMQRERKFRSVCWMECSAAAVDVLITVILLEAIAAPAALLYGAIASEAVRCLASWLFMRRPLSVSLSGTAVNGLIRFARWVWTANVLTVMLNQFDKWVVARYFGPSELGGYQLAQKIAQLVIAEPTSALSAYLFPSFAAGARQGLRQVRARFLAWLRRVVPVACGLAFALYLIGPVALRAVFGREWESAAQLVGWVAVPMVVGAVLAVSIPYVRAIGAPSVVVAATLAQAVVYIPLALWLSSQYGIRGLVTAATLGLVTSAAVVLLRVFPLRSGQ